MPTAIIHRELSKSLIGAFYEVYDRLGYGFLEQVYVRSLGIALSDRGIESALEVPVQVRFRGQVVGDYRADLVVDGQIIVECKTSPGIHPNHEKQLLNYLAASRYRLGYLLNFGPRPAFRRFVMSYGLTRRSGLAVDVVRTDDS